ncbi:exported hypothetical protein [Planktothrix sp. PCC 11201]|nr:exported hypothetical protein [Planktothrix sp. PCC 11201]
MRGKDRKLLMQQQLAALSLSVFVSVPLRGKDRKLLPKM